MTAAKGWKPSDTSSHQAVLQCVLMPERLAELQGVNSHVSSGSKEYLCPSVEHFNSVLKLNCRTELLRIFQRIK